jgi:hypothetical protein
VGGELIMHFARIEVRVIFWWMSLEGRIHDICLCGSKLLKRRFKNIELGWEWTSLMAFVNMTINFRFA